MRLCHNESNSHMREIRKKQFNLHSEQKLKFRELLRNSNNVNFRENDLYPTVAKGVPSEFRSTVWGSLIRNVHFITAVNYQHMC
jgi:hypothetical protein